ncbi:methyltransferase domain-containing protein [uncultured Stenotrophomonas sp.]|uniref:methyltransferase domain-containing protein n=1 Tax=uncultured Stenotrophomonas sp. TaxID=165438 RepID=UPI0028EFB02A|nr:methyltransferase domain-containing protein [uncultured Stenotrophomonas sp.]
MSESWSVGALVAALPEKYQPIFAHPELSDGSSRDCQDRFALIRECARRLQDEVGRPLRVLDLGCAQGFFSLSLAADGHSVHGVDFLDLNVHVCEALAQEHPAFSATFEHGTVEEVIERLQPGEFDLVLGLSVFHHLVHARGIVAVAELCRKLSESIGAGIFELALREEPLHWAPSLPQDPAELLASFAFTRLLSRQATHLSTVSRPLIYASSRFWYAGDAVGEFTSWSGESHAHGRGTHQQSRRYYFGEKAFVKKMTLGMGGRAEINLQEFQNESEFLRNPPASYPAPRLLLALNDASDLYLVRERMEGRLLSELIDDRSTYDADQVISELLNQLVLLEREGLYHNDVRCWNVLISPDGHATLIDYGAISANASDCSWLGDLLLSFLITTREIIERRIVPSNPEREPALSFATLPPRYRNAFIALFSQEQARWTFADLSNYLARAEDIATPAPDWTAIYQHLQAALISYNTRLSALYAQTEHDRVELAARGAALERLREAATQAQEDLAKLKIDKESADSHVMDLEGKSAQLVEWAKDLEVRAIRAAELEALGVANAVRIAELSAAGAASATQIKDLEEELERRREAQDLAEKLAGDVDRLTDERAVLQLKLSQQTQRIDKLDQASVNDRSTIKQLKAELSQGAQTMGTSLARVRELESIVATLESQLADVYQSRSWRLTAPVRWFTARFMKPGGRIRRLFRGSGPREIEPVQDGAQPSAADAVVEKRLAALDQLGSRIRKSKQ